MNTHDDIWYHMTATWNPDFRIWWERWFFWRIYIKEVVRDKHGLKLTKQISKQVVSSCDDSHSGAKAAYKMDEHRQSLNRFSNILTPNRSYHFVEWVGSGWGFIVIAQAAAPEAKPSEAPAREDEAPTEAPEAGHWDRNGTNMYQPFYRRGSVQTYTHEHTRIQLNTY